eukprot:CAMPEP_0177377034 /NCGR_PEP_ID=MMETSP0368-20130122/45557_1 /TAXON_ID=447022 ORGANISM="Scrippsiella hangoei-like, Strain SHHI-4" /NCGR_SAMPLE_ID=MMETSP0368 /ASSEMBLY_ACC=CAM_ASM_000363 /LENGTH=147 /DNA_ID=CAMNT_0018840833 /DNA_START=300 /DNA_END=743 /DNA_ORIENTATION=+
MAPIKGQALPAHSGKHRRGTWCGRSAAGLSLLLLPELRLVEAHASQGVALSQEPGVVNDRGDVVQEEQHMKERVVPELSRLPVVHGRHKAWHPSAQQHTEAQKREYEYSFEFAPHLQQEAVLQQERVANQEEEYQEHQQMEQNWNHK